MPRSRVALLAWIVAIAFIGGTALRFVDMFNLVATRPDLGEVNLIEMLDGTAAYRQAIWPVFLWTNLLFAIGFAASVALAFSVSAARGGLPTFLSLVTVGGIIAATASIIPLGAVNASVWQLYCDCGFKETEMISQFWAQNIAEDVATWLGRFGSVLLAVGLVALIRDAGALLSPTLKTWTWLVVLGLVLVPLLGITEITGDPAIEGWVGALTGAVLVPVWAVWLSRSVGGGEPSAA